MYNYFKVGEEEAVNTSTQENNKQTSTASNSEVTVLKTNINKEMKTEHTKEKIVKGKIYSLSYLMNEGIRFGFLSGNRAIKPKAINAKTKSIKQYGIISPCLIVSAEECLKQGLLIITDEGDIIDKDYPDLSTTFIIIDGAHRHNAAKEINKDKEPGLDVFEECYYYLPLSDKASISALLREANVVTIPWAGSDYLTNLIINNPDAAKNEMLKWVHNMIQTSGDTAAWQWARLIKKAPTKAQLIRATSENPDKAKEAYDKIADDTFFEDGKKLYQNFRRTFSEEILGCKFMPEWVIETISYLVDKDCKKKNAISIIQEFANSLVRENAEQLESIKKGTERAKEVKSLLTEWFNKFMEDRSKSEL